MESLGEKLRGAREEKNVSRDQVGRETNIATRYIDALEREDFSVFPGEAYLVGFLRNYGAYLGLNVEELVSLYRNFKKMEQPVPEALLKPPSNLPKILLGVAAAVVALCLVGGGVFLLASRPRSPQKIVSAERSPESYMMNGDSVGRRFYPGDTILVSLGESQYKLELEGLGETVTIRAPGGSVILDLGQEAELDLDNDGAPDLRVTAVDFAKNNAGMGVQIRLDMNGATVAPVAAAAGADTPVVESVNAAVLAAAQEIFSSPNPYPFTLQSNFQGFCMFRWEILNERDRRGRNEQYFQRSDELNILAQNGIRVWTSNATAAKFQVIGGGRTVPVELGGAGEVVVADFRWVRDDDNRYRLILSRLETGNS